MCDICVVMTKFQLEVEYEYDFDLIGISCHARDYRIVWSLNKALGLQLVKKKSDFDLKAKRQKEATHHSIYEYHHVEDHVEYILLLNKSGNSVIVPEHKSVDYLLILQNNFTADLDDLLQKIKSIELVLTAFRIDVDSLKSKENLIF